MLFGIVFIKKKAKNRKKRGAEKSLLRHISTTEALWDIIQTDSQSYSAGLQLLFFSIFGSWSCDHPPDNLSDGP